MARKGSNKAVWMYAFKHYTSEPLVHPDCPNIKYEVCSLCGNSGFIDTRETAFSAKGVKVGKLHYCICPNGQTMRYYKSDPDMYGYSCRSKVSG